MAAIGLEHPPPFNPPPQRRQKRVEHRHTQRQQGNQHQGAHLAFHRSHDRQCRNRIAQKVASAVAEENAGRIEIKAQKSHDRPAQRRKIHRAWVVSRHDRQNNHQQASEKHHPTRQAVQTVDQVHRIDEEKKPENRDQIAENAELNAVSVKKYAADRDPAGKSKRRPGNLKEQLNPRIQPPEVVPQPAAENDQRPVEAESRPVIKVKRLRYPGGKQIHDRHHGHKGNKNRQSSNPRDRRRVNLPRHRHIHRPQAHPQPPHHIGENRRKDYCNDENNQ